MAFPHDYHLGVWRDFLAAVEERRPRARVGTRGAESASRPIEALLAAAAGDGKVKVPLTP